MTTTNIATAFLFGDSPSSIFLWVIAAIPFFFATWEEYYLGSMDFPFINGPNEGCVFIGVLLIIRAEKGVEYFTQVTSWGWELRYVMIAGFLVASVLNGAWNVYHVYTSSDRRREALTNTLPFWYFLTAVLLLYLFSPAQLLHTQTRWVLVCLGCAFAKEMAALQLGHVTGSEYMPLGLTNFALLTALMINTMANRIGYTSYRLGLVQEVHFLWVLTLLSVGSYCHMAYWVAIEISKELKIPIFAVPSKPHAAPASGSIQLV